MPMGVSANAHACRKVCDTVLRKLSASTSRKKAPEEVDKIGLKMIKAGVERLSQDAFKNHFKGCGAG